MKLQIYNPTSTDRETLLQQSINIINNIPQWELVKTNENTKIYKSTIGDDFWCGRVSQLESKYTSNLKHLIIGEAEVGKTHSDLELEYIHEVKSVEIEQLQKYPDGYSYELKAIYDLGFPLKNRVFHVLIHIYTFDTYAIVSSVPINGDNKEKNVQAQYVSVEKVNWENEASVEWIMATASNPGGWIPDWITRKGMPGAVERDVPSLTTYIDTKM